MNIKRRLFLGLAGVALTGAGGAYTTRSPEEGIERIVKTIFGGRHISAATLKTFSREFVRERLEGSKKIAAQEIELLKLAKTGLSLVGSREMAWRYDDLISNVTSDFIRATNYLELNEYGSVVYHGFKTYRSADCTNLIADFS